MNRLLDHEEAHLYYGMIARGLPAGAVAYAVLLLPPYPPVATGLVIAASALFALLSLILAPALLSRGRRAISTRELAAQNVLANAAVVLGMWGLGEAQGSITPLLLLILLYNAVWGNPWLMRMSWMFGTAGEFLGLTLAGGRPWPTIASTVVFAVAGAASQLAVGFAVRRVRELARTVDLERQVSAHAARAVEPVEAFRLMLPPAAQLLGVDVLAVVSTTPRPHAVSAVCDGAPAAVDAATLDLGSGLPLGSMVDGEPLLLCTTTGRRPQPDALAAVSALFVPVIERGRQMRSLHHQARMDGLTGLANRRHMDEWMSAITERREAYALIIIDLDHFKRLNDTEGHLAGDDVLVRAGDLLRGVARSEDLTARFGGEELCLVLPHADARAARAVTARLRERWDRSGMGVSFSAGIACTSGGEAPEAVIARADAALYAAKLEGRARTVCV
ncbi:MAG: diguanylate cyclase [Thermoleophilia bacterium]